MASCSMASAATGFVLTTPSSSTSSSSKSSMLVFTSRKNNYSRLVVRAAEEGAPPAATTAPPEVEVKKAVKPPPIGPKRGTKASNFYTNGNFHSLQTLTYIKKKKETQKMKTHNFQSKHDINYPFTVHFYNRIIVICPCTFCYSNNISRFLK